MSSPSFRTGCIAAVWFNIATLACNAFAVFAIKFVDVMNSSVTKSTDWENIVFTASIGVVLNALGLAVGTLTAKQKKQFALGWLLAAAIALLISQVLLTFWSSIQ